MTDEIKVIKKEIEAIELKIELSKKFFEQVNKSKKEVAEKRGYDVSYGKYIEEAMDDMVKIIDQLSQRVQQLEAMLQYQGQIPQVIEKNEEPEPGTHVSEEPTPEGMYAKTTNKELKDPMFG